MTDCYCGCPAVANESSRYALRPDFLAGIANGRDVIAIKSGSYPSLGRAPNLCSNKIRDNTLRRCGCSRGSRSRGDRPPLPLDLEQV